MPKRAGGKKPLSFLYRKLRWTKGSDPPPLPPVASSDRLSPANPSPEAPTGVVSKGGKKKTGARLWMRFNRTGQSEIRECDKSMIIRLAGIPARDLRILGPVFSQSSNILAREKAIVLNLEYIRLIITAEEILILDPLSQEVRPFVDQLKHQIPSKALFEEKQEKDSSPNANHERDLPFEFQVLEVALEVVCSSLGKSAIDLENGAYPVLDELAKNVSTKNLERVRSLKSNLTRLLARVQKVRDEIEHLLDDNDDMSHLYLTRKQLQAQQIEAMMTGGTSSSIIPVSGNLMRYNSSFRRSASIATSIRSDNDVEDLEMLLEAYFMQLDGIRNGILSVREYIDDTEDYVNIQLDNQRNELIQLQLILTMASFGIALNTFIAGAFAMNIQSSLYNTTTLFWPFVGGTSTGSFVIFLVMLGYARWMKLLGP